VWVYEYVNEPRLHSLTGAQLTFNISIKTESRKNINGWGKNRIKKHLKGKNINKTKFGNVCIHREKLFN